MKLGVIQPGLLVCHGALDCQKSCPQKEMLLILKNMHMPVLPFLHHCPCSELNQERYRPFISYK